MGGSKHGETSPHADLALSSASPFCHGRGGRANSVAVRARYVWRERHGGLSAEEGRVPKPAKEDRRITKRKRPLHTAGQIAASLGPRHDRERSPGTVALCASGRSGLCLASASATREPRNQRRAEVSLLCRQL